MTAVVSALRPNAVVVAVETGLSASVVLSTLLKPTSPLTSPDTFAEVTASSSIFAVVTASSGIFAVVIALS